MLLPVILLLIIVLFGILSKKISKRSIQVYLIIIFIIFGVLVGFRNGNIGNDTVIYLKVFNNISNSGEIIQYVPRFEYGYLYLNLILSKITDNEQSILIITGFFTMLIYFLFISKYSKLIWLSIFLFFTLGYFGMAMNTIRLQIAIVITILSYAFLRKNKLIPFLMLVIIAFFFHRTAIIFLLAWPIVKLKLNFKIIFFSFLGTLILFFSFPYFLNLLIRIFPTYEYYLDSVYNDGNIRLASIINFILGAGMLVVGSMIKPRNSNPQDILNDKKNNIINDYNNMKNLIFFGILLIFISLNFNLLDRVGDYFIVYGIIFLPNSITKIRNINIKTVIKTLIVVLLTIYYFSILIYRPEWNRVYPYEFFNTLSLWCII